MSAYKAVGRPLAFEICRTTGGANDDPALLSSTTAGGVSRMVSGPVQSEAAAVVGSPRAAIGGPLHAVQVTPAASGMPGGHALQQQPQLLQQWQQQQQQQQHHQQQQ